MHELVYTKKDLDTVAQAIGELSNQCSIFTFTGSLGAGKTTLIAKVLKRMGVVDHVTSPTFTYLQVYRTADGKKIFHFDLYRVDSLDAFMRAGFDEYLYQPDSLVFIEWPEHVVPLLDHAVCHVHIEYKDQESRILRYSVQNDDKKSA